MAGKVVAGVCGKVDGGTAVAAGNTAVAIVADVHASGKTGVGVAGAELFAQGRRWKPDGKIAGELVIGTLCQCGH